MKKVVFSLLAVLTLGVASAQDLTSKKGEYYLPQEGDWSIQFDATNALKFVGNAFNGSISNDVVGLGSSNTFGFVGKQFINDNQAYRYIADIQFNVKKITNVDTKVNFGATLGLGKEWRKGSTRLQGFYGADAFVSLLPLENKPSTFKFGAGVQGFVGAEYFFLPKMSIGAQYSYAVSLTYNKQSSVSNFEFNAGGVQTPGVGTAALLLNLYF